MIILRQGKYHQHGLQPEKQDNLIRKHLMLLAQQNNQHLELDSDNNQ